MLEALWLTLPLIVVVRLPKPLREREGEPEAEMEDVAVRNEAVTVGERDRVPEPEREGVAETLRVRVVKGEEEGLNDWLGLLVYEALAVEDKLTEAHALPVALVETDTRGVRLLEELAEGVFVTVVERDREALPESVLETVALRELDLYTLGDAVVQPEEERDGEREPVVDRVAEGGRERVPVTVTDPERDDVEVTLLVNEVVALREEEGVEDGQSVEDTEGLPEGDEEPESDSSFEGEGSGLGHADAEGDRVLVTDAQTVPENEVEAVVHTVDVDDEESDPLTEIVPLNVPHDDADIEGDAERLRESLLVRETVTVAVSDCKGEDDAHAVPEGGLESDTLLVCEPLSVSLCEIENVPVTEALEVALLEKEALAVAVCDVDVVADGHTVKVGDAESDTLFE